MQSIGWSWMNVEFEKSSAIVSILKASKRKSTALSCSCSAIGGARDRNRKFEISEDEHEHEHECECQCIVHEHDFARNGTCNQREVLSLKTKIEERTMRVNWMRTSVFALTLGVLSWSLPSQLQAQPGGISGLGEGGGTAGGAEGSGPRGGMSGPSPEYLRLQKEFREKFKGLVHVTHEIRVGNVKALSQSGLALLIKKSAPELSMGGMGSMGGISSGDGYGGTGMGGMGGGYTVEYEIIGAKELLLPELRPELAELVRTLDAKQVVSRYVIRDLVSDTKIRSAFVNYAGLPDVVEKNGVSLLSLSLHNGTILTTDDADLDINQVASKGQDIYDVPANSFVPAISEVAKIGTAVVAANGGIGIAITRNGKVETLSGRELFNAYVDLLLLKKKQQAEKDPFGSVPTDDPFGNSGPAVAANDKRNSDPFAADVAAKSSSSSKRNADSDFDIEKRSIDDALVLALTAYKQSKDKASKEAAASQLKQILRDQFDSLRAIRRAEIDDLRSRLDQLESDESSKTNRRDEIIAERYKRLVP